MPALPESYSNVRSCITADEIDIEKMADYIVQDVSISSTLLHWANSALFGQRFQVDTIKKAIIVLGTDIVENLILSESVNKTIAGKRPDIKGFDFQQFKKHSMATAVIARLLIKSVHSSDAVKHDRAFISGLLHDMGKLAMASFFPRQFEDAISTARKKSCALLDAEQETCGSNHAEVGAFLAEWWTLPPFIVNAICWHHAPQATPVDQDIIAATHVANLLSYQFHYGSGAEVPDRPIEERYGEMFYLNDEALEYIRTKTEKTIMKLVR
jgi:putative nucleotidyltransferase with HDIG domain